MSFNNLPMDIPLDHGGVIYPYTHTSKWTQSFRIEVQLDEDIDTDRLFRAIKKVQKRFPYHFVCVSRNFFKFWLTRVENLTKDIIVHTDEICAAFNLKDKTKPAVRFTVNGNLLGFEVFHTVTDGYGASIVFKNVIAEYYRDKGEEIPLENGLRDLNSSLQEYETEDSFMNVYESGGKTVSRAENAGYQYNGAKQTSKDLKLTYFELPVSALKEKSAQYNASMTKVLAAVYTKALCRRAVIEKAKNDVKVQIAINLRQRFKSQTLRNFSLYFFTSVAKSYADSSIEEILKVIDPQFEKGTSLEKLRNDAYTNVSQQDMFLFRMLPRFIKQIALRIGTVLFGERIQTGPFSNVGIFDLPEALQKHVIKAGMIIGKTICNTVYSTACSYNNTFYWSVASVVEEKFIEDELEKVFREADIPYVRIDRN